MIQAASTLYLLALLAYCAAALAWPLGRAVRNGAWSRGGFWVLAGAVGAHTATGALHLAAAAGLPPDAARVGPWDHPFSMLAWIGGVAVVAVGLRSHPARAIGAILAPVLAALVFGALLVEDTDAVSGFLPSLLDSVWVTIHTLAVYASFALFALAFGSGVLYLQADQHLRRGTLDRGVGRAMPSLQLLDRVNERAFSGGLVGLTIGVVAGTFWALVSDPGLDLRAKGSVTLGLWLLYAVGWQARYLLGWGGRRAAWFAIVGFGGLLVSVVGVAHG